MIIAEALSAEIACSDSARVDIEVMLSHVLQQDRAYLYTWPEKPLTDKQKNDFLRCLTRRQHGEPVAHIVGYREFWSLHLEVNNSTLIPRPDTELLVEWALECIDGMLATAPSRAMRVLDLGTGTGAIALALASERPSLHVCGVDASKEAVILAQRNASRLQLNTVQFYHSDWYQSVDEQQDLIVSNPPYIDGSDPHLGQGDVSFEPRSALVADQAGLRDLNVIIDGAGSRLKSGGWLIVEHGYQQGDAVRQLMRQAGFSGLETRKDLGGNERASAGQWLVAAEAGV